MKKIIIFLLSFLILQAAITTNDDAIDSILKTISKNSPEYSLDMLYVNKIKHLEYKKELFKTVDIKSEREYISYFKKLAEYIKYISIYSQHKSDLLKKMDILKPTNTPTQKLEYLYYKKLNIINKKRYEYLTKMQKIWLKSLYQKLSHINFDTKNALNSIKQYELSINSLNNNIEQLKIELEKWTLVNDKKSISYTKNRIKQLKSKILDIYKKESDSYLVLLLDSIKQKDKKAFKLDKKLYKLVSIYDNQLSEAYKNIISYFEKERFGNTQLFLNNTLEEVKNALQKVWSILNYPLFTIEQKDISLINFFIFLLLLYLGSLLAKYYKKSITTLKHKYNISNSTVTLLSNIGYYLILIISFLIALKSMGLDLSSFTLIAGALSVGIGFGLQNIVSNFVSGIILMFEKSIKIGDYIQIDEQTRGTVVDIKMRSLTIRTNDNIDLIVPNQNFIQNIVTNWTLNDKSRRFRIPFGVAYGTKVEDVERVVLDSLKHSKLPHYKIGSKKPQVIFTSLGDSSINFELFIWVKDELTLRPRYTTSEVLKIIYKSLNEANITIPFPQQDIYIKELPNANSHSS